MKQKSTIIMILVLFTINIMKVVNIFNTVNFNLALSDLLVPIALLLILKRIKNEPFNEVLPNIKVTSALLLWIFIVGLNAIFNISIFTNNWTGLLSEWTKTAICISYYYIGYNILKYIDINLFKKTWSLATIFFVVWGIFASYLVMKGVDIITIIEPRYKDYFLGTDTDPNHAATTLFISFFGIGAMQQLTSSKFSSILGYIAMAFSLLGIVFTTSRGGIISLFVGILLLLLGFSFLKAKKSSIIIISLLLLTVLSVQADQIFNDGYYMENTINKLENLDTGIEVRYGLGKSAFLMGKDHILFGVGRGNYKLNSEGYFDKIGIQYYNDIPHNTYFGTFAETGLIGFLLFFSPLFIILIMLYKYIGNNKQLFKYQMIFWIWIVSGTVALGIQSWVLNVENRRFLWFLAGVITYFIIKIASNIELKQISNYTNLSKKLSITLIIILAPLLIFTIFTASIDVRSQSYSNDLNYQIPNIDTSDNQVSYISYEMYLESNELKTPRLQVSIVECSDESEIVIDSFKYWACSGIITRKYIKIEGDSEIELRFKILDDTLEKYSFKPVSLESNNNDYSLEKNLVLLNALNKIFKKEYVLTKNNVKSKDSKINEVHNLKVANMLLVKNINHELINGVSTIKVSIEALEDIAEDYYLFMYAYPENIHMLYNEEFEQGFKELESITLYDTSSWKKDDLYEILIVAPTAGKYELKFGFVTITSEGLKYLNFNESDSTYSLGWINFD